MNSFRSFVSILKYFGWLAQKDMTVKLAMSTGKQGSREAGLQGSRVAGLQGSREAGFQGNREAGKQGCREAGL